MVKQVAGKTVEEALSGSRAVVCLDGGGGVTGINQAARKLLGLREAEVEGRRLSSLVDAVDVFGNRLCGDFCGLREMAQRGETIATFPLDLASERGSERRRFVLEVEVAGGAESAELLLLLYLRPDRRRGASPGRDRGPLEDRDTRAVDLTRRQKEILQRLAAGASPQTIAQDLSISIHTVRKHIQACLGKLGANSQAHAIAEALRRQAI